MHGAEDNPDIGVDNQTLAAATQAARDSYSRLVSYLAARTHDLAAAEDALADAFCAALVHWPKVGVPGNPEAWLLVSANNRLRGHARHQNVKGQAGPTLRLVAQEAEMRASQATKFPDERLKLLFICAHPAINLSVRTPLMLQTVLGLDASKIASAFLVSPAAMSQRLVRAKAKIRAARIPFRLPAQEDLPQRLDGVLQAIYAAYGTGWEQSTSLGSRDRGLVEEALWLARLVVDLIPQEPEPKGLLALMLYCEARRKARRTKEGEYVPLSEQNPMLWSFPKIVAAERLLFGAFSHRNLGRFQLEAAIQSAHTHQRGTREEKWKAIAQLYDKLVSIAPTIGALTGRAVAVAEARGVAEGLMELEKLNSKTVATYQPFWAVKADLLAKLKRFGEAENAYARAISLCQEGAVRRFLQKKLLSLGRQFQTENGSKRNLP